MNNDQSSTQLATKKEKDIQIYKFETIRIFTLNISYFIPYSQKL
ncbi:hypothetical protein KORDIASMS9_01786 [Kordia sp. SMS9]|nr:hypothetical protein KORDIASMS9_01786 [Kordia sp. SMS9]